jgi:flagellar export protein FliJ
MSNGERRGRDSLTGVARWRALELEDARLAHAAADKALNEQQRVYDEIHSRMEDSREFERQASSHGVSAEALRHARAYTQWETRQLEQQREHVVAAERAVTEARAEVVSRFQAVRVIDRLRERRARDAAIEATRAEQKLLDEHALLREARHHSNTEHQQWPSMRSE